MIAVASAARQEARRATADAIQNLSVESKILAEEERGRQLGEKALASLERVPQDLGAIKKNGHLLQEKQQKTAKLRQHWSQLVNELPLPEQVEAWSRMNRLWSSSGLLDAEEEA